MSTNELGAKKTGFKLKQQEHTLPPWTKGPYEIISHSDEHLKQGKDTDRRIALIGYDNAIEICIDVFITLHPKVRGGIELSKDELEKAKSNYHTKLEFFYNYAKKMNTEVGLPIQNVIWYHQLRNELYHSGNGFVPENQALLGAQAAAYLIFKVLFNINLDRSISDDEVEGMSDNEVEEWLNLFDEERDKFIKRSGEPPNDTDLINKIMKTKGHIFIWKSTSISNRYWRVCLLPDSRYGIQIIYWEATKRKWEFVTAFAKDKLMTLDQIRDYISRSGLVEYDGELPQPIDV